MKLLINKIIIWAVCKFAGHDWRFSSCYGIVKMKYIYDCHRCGIKKHTRRQKADGMTKRHHRTVNAILHRLLIMSIPLLIMSSLLWNTGGLL